MSSIQQNMTASPLDCTKIITMLGAMQNAAEQLRAHALFYEADFLASNFNLLDDFFAGQIAEWVRNDLI